MTKGTTCILLYLYIYQSIYEYLYFLLAYSLLHIKGIFSVTIAFYF